jgi:tetratricopeptide (TPR) repeat protein
MSDDAPFNFRVQHLPAGEAVTSEEIEARMLRQLDEPGGDRKQALHNLAIVYGRTRRFEEAKKCLKALLEMTDDIEEKARGILNMGCLMEQMGDYVAATTFYQTAFSMEPCRTDIWYFINNNLGFSLNQLGRFSEAAKYLRAAIDVDPTRSNAHKNLGLCLQGMGDYAGAAACFVAATRANASDGRSAKHLAALIASNPELLTEAPGLEQDLQHCVKAVDVAKSMQANLKAGWQEARTKQEPPEQAG